MDARARAQELIDQLAGEIGLEGLAFDGAGVIDLNLDDGRQVSLGLDVKAEVILLLGPLAGPTAGLSRTTLRRLLEAGAEEGPLVVLDDGHDCLCLQDRFPLAAADYASFKERLLAFMAAQDRWLDELGSELAAVPDATTPMSTAWGWQSDMLRG